MLRSVSAGAWRGTSKYSSSLAPATAMLAFTSSRVSPSVNHAVLELEEETRSSTGAPTSRRNVRHGSGTQNCPRHRPSPCAGTVDQFRGECREPILQRGHRFGANIGSRRRAPLLVAGPSISRRDQRRRCRSCRRGHRCRGPRVAIDPGDVVKPIEVDDPLDPFGARVSSFVVIDRLRFGHGLDRLHEQARFWGRTG